MLGQALVPGQQPDPAEFFEGRIRPVLVNSCFTCHTNVASGGLRLDSRDALLKGGKSGPALVAGDPDHSLLIRAVRQVDAKLKMPMGGRLKDSEVRDLETWVAMGAPWPESKNAAKTPSDAQRQFWSFRPLEKPEAPPSFAIDHFIRAELKEHGLDPAAPADERTLIRRVTFDLIGLPPTPEEIKAFLTDSSPDAYLKVVNRLLASRHYGERWARYWLDLARYGEDDVRGSMDPPKPVYPNAWRYRDWVIEAFNRDMPYDLFLKAQIAGDLLHPDNHKNLIAGTGFFGLGPWYYDTVAPPEGRAGERHDRIDALTRSFLGLTVACARCHDHKYDPVTIQDYYALAGVFAGTEYQEYPLASPDIVTAYKRHKLRIKDQETAIREYIQAQSRQLGEILARKTAAYMVASRTPQDPAVRAGLDAELLDRWNRYLNNTQRDHPFLKAWDEMISRRGSTGDARKIAAEFQDLVLALVAEKKEMDEENQVIMAPFNARKKKDERLFPNAFSNPEDYCEGCGVEVKSMPRDRFVLWRELFGPSRTLADNITRTPDGVFYYGEGKIERFLSGEWKGHLDTLRAELEVLKKSSPPLYPYLHGIADIANPANIRIHIRGSPYNLGEEAQRRFLAVLSSSEPAPFRKGSGRLELAEAVASHPLAARVMANRIWAYHFGRGIVGTPSNFGFNGDRPSHPELLEYLAARFVESGWSVKSLHREILLSATYRLSSDVSERNFATDPENRLLWRSNRRRLDLEALRDSMLSVAGVLDPAVGGPSFEWTQEANRRTIYGKVSRVKVHDLLALFDFPDPAATSERRNVTNVPLQRLFFMNSDFVARQAQSLAERLRSGGEPDDSARIRKAYVLLYGREASDEEIRLGLEFLRPGPSAWPQYTQALMAASEFFFIN